MGRFRARIDANSIPREVYSHGNFCLYHFETLCLTIEAYRAKFKDIVPHLLKLTRHPGFTLTELYNSSLHPVEVAEKFSRIGDYEQIPREIYFSTIRQVVTLAFSDVFKDRQREE